MRFPLTLAALTLAAPAFAGPFRQPPPKEVVQNAAEVLDDWAKLKMDGIPANLVKEAQGIAIIPKVLKAGLIVGGRGGHGVVMARLPDGTWGDPVFVNFGGGSVGFQVGVESTDLILVFKNRNSLDRIMQGKAKVTLGADAAVAAGPVGRQVAAATDAKAEAEVLSYSRSRGLFAGVALDGAVLRADPNQNAAFRPATDAIERGLADGLKTRLMVLSGELVIPQVAVPGNPPPVIRP